MKTLLNVVYFGISITYGMHLDSISLKHITILNKAYMFGVSALIICFILSYRIEML